MGKKSKRRQNRAGGGGKKKSSRQAGIATVVAGNDAEADGALLLLSEETKIDSEGDAGSADDEKELTVRELFDYVRELVVATADNPWWYLRTVLFEDYCHCMSSVLEAYGDGKIDNPVTEEDRKFLKGLVRSAVTEPAFFVVPSLYLLGGIAAHVDHNLEEWCRCTNNVIILCDKATKEETERPLDLLHDKTIHTCGDWLAMVRALAVTMLKDFRMQGYFIKLDQNQLVAKLSRVPGDQCDGCGCVQKPIGEMMVCRRCRVTYYCSLECYKKHWKFMHKRLCREKGEFRVGDYVVCREPFGSVKVGGHCRVVAAGPECDDDDAEDSWVVSENCGDKTCVVSATKLRVNTLRVRGVMDPTEIIERFTSQEEQMAVRKHLKRLEEEWEKKVEVEEDFGKGGDAVVSDSVASRFEQVD